MSTKAEYQHDWYMKNRERILVRNKQYYKDHPRTDAQRKHRTEHRRAKREKNPLKYSQYDKEYEKRESTRILRKAHRDRKQAIIRAFKTGPCMDCTQHFNPWQMDFDHRPGEKKLFNIASIGSNSLTRIIDEIAKCDLVCANCHRERTYRRSHSV